ncbi:hypothetical protein [Nonomuraea sp. NPDC049725]|uniref:hypothetical protein n=1 Tax=Nonomuraea sp. NPDC049725 TaxID=3154508 RepID=UPI00342936E4
MATEHSGAPHLPPSWPEAPREDVPTSWPETPPAAQQPPTAWPEAPPAAAWPEPPGRSSQPEQFSWADATRPEAQPAQRDAEPVPTSWPTTGQHTAGQPSPGQPADPAPAWSEPPAAQPGAWANLSSPAPWPPQDSAAPRHQSPSPLDTPYSAPPPDQPVVPTSQAADERTMTYSQVQAQGHAHPQGHGQTPGHTQSPGHTQPPGHGQPHAAPVAEPQQQPIQPLDQAHDPHQQPGEHQAQHGRPGANLSRDPSDPDRPFVTAGQISGSRTPPPERQQQLWDTVFGDDYNEMGEPETLEEGKPIWIYALAGSVAIALVAGLLWAFLAGPLAGAKETPPAAQETAKTPPPGPQKTTSTIPRLPKFPGKASGVTGTLPDAAAGISVPRLGGTWRLDERPTVKGTYGFETRQYAMVGTNLAAQVLTGPLPERLASSYAKPGELEPAIKAVVVDARKRLFEMPNRVKKIAQQELTVGDAKGMLIAYALTSASEKATIVTAALDTGAELPAVVYMSVPEEGENLRPDLNTVINRLKVTAQG